MAASPYDANQADFLGEGTAAPAQAPALSAQQMEEDRRRKEEWLRNQGLDANGQQLPAYGTPQNQGGTATGFQVTTQPTIGTGAMREVNTQRLGFNNAETAYAAMDMLGMSRLAGPSAYAAGFPAPIPGAAR